MGQQPVIVGIGTVVVIGEWRYTVEGISRDGVTARSENGRLVFIDRKTIETAATPVL